MPNSLMYRLIDRYYVGLKIVNMVLCILFKIKMKTDKTFRKFCEGYNCSIVMKTFNNLYGTRFIFKDGTFTWDSDLENYDAALVWIGGLTAMIQLLKGTDQAVLESVQKHKAAIKGSVHLFNWFGSAMNYVMGRSRPRPV